MKEPNNLNPGTPSNFKFEIRKLPNVTYFLQDADLPTITLGSVPLPNPHLNFNVPGDDLNFAPLALDFIVDEDFNNYKELYNWMLSIQNPNKYASKLDEWYSDGVLTILTNNKNYNMSVTFFDLYPITIGDVGFNVSSEGEPITCNVDFDYSHFEFNKF
jgi:hypothetical protein